MATMKFGKRMQECLFYHWAEWYLNYNNLKKALKAGVRGRSFLSLLQIEVDRVERFFTEKESELSQVLHGFEQRTITMQDVGFIELCLSLDRLREFVLVNYLAVRKIVKKHDKLCDSQQRITSEAARLLSRSTFYKCPRMTATLVRVEGLLASVFFSVNTQPDGICSLCCRKSRHIIMLPCQHRFCWGCFATEMMPTCDCCIVCGSSTGLDPDSFQMSSLLKTVADKIGLRPNQTPEETRSWLESEAEKSKYATSYSPLPSSGTSSSYGTLSAGSNPPGTGPFVHEGDRLRLLRRRYARAVAALREWSAELVRGVQPMRRYSLLGVGLVMAMAALALQQVWARGQEARPYLFWNGAYIVACVGLHFFVSPVTQPTVSSAPTPSYTLFIKVLHFWLICSFVIFHLPMWEIFRTDDSDASSLLLPLFALNLPGLVIWDALARRGYFSLSYGRNFLELALNSLILSSICVFHGHYCANVDVHVLGLTLCPTSFQHQSLVARLVCFCLVGTTILLCNYWFQHKKELPGILWGGALERAPAPARRDQHPTNTHPMVSWYSILQFSTAVNLLVSLKLFLGRFDMRVLHNKLRFAEESRQVYTHFADRKELWFDFTADVGDGFHPSYMIARLLAQPSLEVPRSLDAMHFSSDETPEVAPTTTTLPRGQLLVIGGDLAYPGPSYETYTQRFIRPFEDALPPSGTERLRSLPTNKPTMDELASYRGPQAFCIPGNHDWLDGLEIYLRMVCCSKWLGGWLLPQTTSYFALKLPHGWWLFGLDNGLAMDIDVAQFQYFSWVAEEHVGPNDRVIVVTHEPGWVLDNYFRNSTQNNVKDLIRYVLGERCVLRLAGDLHHYSRHVPVQRSNVADLTDAAPPRPVLVVSGGGGAFLHPTHIFESGVMEYDGQAYRRVAAYPPPKVSRSYGALNVLRFRQVNWHFDVVGGSLYFLFVHTAFPMPPATLDHILQADGVVSAVGAFLATVAGMWGHALTQSVPTLLAMVIIVLVLVGFVDVSVRKPLRVLLGVTHAVAHIASAFCLCLGLELAFEAAVQHKVLSGSTEDGELHGAFYGLMEQLPLLGRLLAAMPDFLHTVARLVVSTFDLLQFTAILRNRILHLGFAALSPVQCILYFGAMSLLYYVVAAPFVSFLFGIYLFICVTFLNSHWDEGFSSLQIEHYKNFCRLHVRPNGDLEVFVIGVDHVPSQFCLDPQWGSGSCEMGAAGEAPGPMECVSPTTGRERGIANCCTSFTGTSARSSAAMWEVGSTISDARLDETTLPPSYTWARPSRWVPEGKHSDAKMIDHFIIPCSTDHMRW
eukprot:EG_transcript_674